VIIPKGYLPNVKAETKTKWGNVVLWNALICHAFGEKIDFLTGKLTAPGIEKLIIPKLTDDPEEYTEEHFKDKDKIYVRENIIFADGALYFSGLNDIATPTATPKLMSKSPNNDKIKNALFEKHAHELDDPAVIAYIEGELLAEDDRYLEGDESEGYLIFKKTKRVARKKMKLMHGAEDGFRTDGKVQNIPTALDDGWNIDYLPAMANSGRAGSNARGKETAEGGESVKFFYRGFQNSSVVYTDCGSKMGHPTEVTTSNYMDLVGYTVIFGGVTKLEVNETVALSYVGKTVEVRSPGYCLEGASSYCSVCLGAPNSISKNGLMQAASDVGSQFMGIRMSAMHGKELATNKYLISSIN